MLSILKSLFSSNSLGSTWSRGGHREGSLTCSTSRDRDYGVFLFGMFLVLSVVIKIIPKSISLFPVYCDWSLLIYWSCDKYVNNNFVCMLTWIVTRQRSILLLVKNSVLFLQSHNCLNVHCFSIIYLSYCALLLKSCSCDMLLF